MSIVALIPARGGSKSIKDKNIIDVGGRPLISYAINAANNSELISKTYISTESEKIAKVVSNYNCELISRPPHLATDESPILDTIKDFRSLVKPKVIVLLQPTSPFVLGSQVDMAIREIISESNLDSVQTVCEIPHNFNAFNQRIIDENGYINFLFKKERESLHNKQLKPKTYKFGNLLAINTDRLSLFKTPFGVRSKAIIIDSLFGFDLDTKEDMSEANRLLNLFKEKYLLG